MKSRFKTLAIAAIGTLSIFSAITYSSCQRDKCKAIVCAYNGVCTDGACLCPAGYEGPQCETINRLRFLNDWNVTEDGTLTDAAQYVLTIEKGPNIQEVLIRNFNNLLTDRVSAFVKGDTMYINQQTVNGYTLNGVGYLTDEKYNGAHGKMIVRYQITTGSGLVNDYGLGPASDASLWNK